jgi:CRISPR-associated protein Csm3
MKLPNFKRGEILSSRFDDFDSLSTLTIIEGKLVNKTPIRVGSGRITERWAAGDITPLRIKLEGKDVPYIPGSSLKGVLRSMAESIARAKGIQIHDPWDLESAEKEAEKGEFCVICGTFGSIKLASHVRVYDSYPVDGMEVKTFMKTGVGINRDFRGAQPDILYTEEQVVPDILWRFRMDILNIKLFPEPEDERGRLLKVLLDMLKGGMVQVGARRTIGFGLLELRDGKYTVYVVKEGYLVKELEGSL